jgi:hypothetical protein
MFIDLLAQAIGGKPADARRLIAQFKIFGLEIVVSDAAKAAEASLMTPKRDEPQPSRPPVDYSEA